MPYCTLVLLSSFVAQPSLSPGASLLLHLCLHPQCYQPVIYSSCSRSSHGLPAALQVQGRGAAEVHSPTHSYNVVPETPKKMQTGRSEVAGPQAAVPLCPRRSLISAGLRAALLLPSPSPPPSAFTPLRLLTPGSCRCLSFHHGWQGQESADTPVASGS